MCVEKWWSREEVTIVCVPWGQTSAQLHPHKWLHTTTLRIHFLYLKAINLHALVLINYIYHVKDVASPNWRVLCKTDALSAVSWNMQRRCKHWISPAFLLSWRNGGQCIDIRNFIFTMQERKAGKDVTQMLYWELHCCCCVVWALIISEIRTLVALSLLISRKVFCHQLLVI